MFRSAEKLDLMDTSNPPQADVECQLIIRWFIVKAVNLPTLHHTSILHVYEVFDHLHMLWKGIWVHPYTVMMVQGGGKFWKIGVRWS